MSCMRIFLLGLLALTGCRSKPVSTTIIRTETARQAEEFPTDEPTSLVRATARNVGSFIELRQQGKTQQMRAVHGVIAKSVDDNFDTFRQVALEGELSVIRNMATKCLGFAIKKRREARDTLLVLCLDRDKWIVANAVLGFGTLLDKEMDLAPIIALVGSGDVNIRTNAATALIGLFRVKETPRQLTPQYHTAIERLVTLLHDDTSVRSRRAAVWALANIRHPETLPHLVSALEDDDEQVQIGGLRGLEVLGDQRALEALLRFLEGSPTPEAISWVLVALKTIVVQAGLADAKAEMDDLGESPRKWREYIRNARMK